MGCFYIESPATRLLQQKAARGDYEHMVIHSSIIRPAANDYIQEYLRRLHGGAWQPIHPLLEGILDETYGIMVYQEQVSQAAVAMAGFTHAQGDGLRKVMSKKDKQRALADYHERFVLRGAGAGSGPRQDRRGLANDAFLCRVLLLQAPQRQLRPGLLPGRVSQGPLPGRVHGRGDQQPGRILLHLCLCVRGPAPGA